MTKLIFRNDDVNPNSNFKHIGEIYSIILTKFPNAEIWSCINIFGKINPDGMVYPKTKLRINTRDFYDVDSVFDFRQLPSLHTPVSHGLFHFNHSILTYETQRFSILSSCHLLNTKLFIPPFNEWNEKTEKICRIGNIQLIGDSAYNNLVRESRNEIPLKTDTGTWINIDRNPIDKEHNNYCFHSWKFTPESFKKVLDLYSQNTT